MKALPIVALALASALPLACTNEQTAKANHPESGSPSSGVAEGDHTGADPRNDVDNNPERPTSPSMPSEKERIPEGIAPTK